MLRSIAFNFKTFIVELIKSPALWIGLVAYSLYWAIALVFPTNAVLEASGVFVLIGGVAIFLSWFPSFVMGIISGAKIGAWQLPVGVVLTWIGISERETWALIWRFSGQPEWMLHSHFTGQAKWLLFLSSLLYIIAPGNENGEVPVKNWYILLVSCSLAMFGAGVVITALILDPKL